MLSRRFFVGCSLVLALLFGSAGYLAAADEHATEGHGSEGHAVAEVEPGASDSGHDAAAHGAVDGHGADSHAGESHGDGHGAEHHDPFEDALHGNATQQTGALSGQNNPAEWKSSLAIWTLVVFGCLSALLWKFAWGPICAALDSRERSVQQNIDAAREQNEKAAALLAQHEAQLSATADEVRKILEDARRDAETQKQNILAEAEAAADAQKTRALKEIDAAKNGALQELAEKSVDTAVGLAGKIVQRQLTNEDHSSLISEAIKHFPGNN